ncbi:MAG TPA: hypothetical protein VH374_13090 [Polyangia bacterium]|nr:hypothetical protein [Polyangia bacterium]
MLPAGALILLAGLTAGCSNSETGAGGGSGGSSGATGGSGATAGSGGVTGAGTGGNTGSGGSTGSGGVISPPADAGTGGVDAPVAVDAADGGGAGCSGLFCEDFESGMIDPQKWTMPKIGTATMTVQQTTVAHGKYAVQFHGNAAPPAIDYAYIIASNAPAALAKHNFGRAYFYISAVNPMSPDMGLLYGGTAGFPKPTYMSIAYHTPGWQLGFIKLSGSPGGERQAYPPGKMPVGKWLCLEWEFNDDPDQINVWGDGTMIGSLSNANVAYPPGQAPGSPLFNGMSSNLIGAFTDFGFGFYDWHQQGRPAFDVYYDDIVLDTKRVGCLTPP